MATPLITASIRRQVMLERLKSGEVKRLDKFLRQADKLLRERIGATDFQRRRIERQLAAIGSDLNAIWAEFQTDLFSGLDDIADSELRAEVRALGTVVEAAVAAPSQAAAAALAQPLSARGYGGGKLLKSFVADWSARTTTRVTDVIRQGFFEGRTNAQILQSIRGTKANNYADGLLNVISGGERALVRTAVQHMASQVREQVWAENADIIKAVRWVSTLDDRVCLQCAALDGQEFPVGEGPRPELHVADRCTVTPVLDDEFAGLRQGAKRSSVEGAVDADLSYYEWLKRQPQGFQDVAIGPQRAQLLRDGGLSATRFRELSLNRNFEPMTLAEMQKAEPLAFDRAGLD